MQYKRKMGLDFGKVRIGVAFSDLSSTIASVDHVRKSQGEENDLNYFANLIKEKSVDKVVFGLPLKTDGTESEMSLIVRSFAEKLEKVSGVQVCFQDERLTSFEAEEYLKEAGIKWEKRKELLDKVSAQIILQNYLDENPNK